MIVQSPLKSEGHYALNAWLRRENMIASDFARRAGLSESLVRQLIACLIPAGKKSAAKIERATDGAVPVDAWLDRAKRDPLSVAPPRARGKRTDLEPVEEKHATPRRHRRPYTAGTRETVRRLRDKLKRLDEHDPSQLS